MIKSEITKWFDILKLYSLTYEEIMNLTEGSIHNVILFYNNNFNFYKIKEVLQNNYYRFKIESIVSSVDIGERYFININENFTGEMEEPFPRFSHNVNIIGIKVIKINEITKPIVDLIIKLIKEEEIERTYRFLSKLGEITKYLKMTHGI